MRALVLFCCLAIAALPLWSQQGLDVASLTADPVTLIFSDGKSTVTSYIYYALENETKCCGNAAIYLEVRISPEGKTTGVNAVTGRNECMKKSVADILKRVRWNNATIKTTKSIYFEIKPAIACKGKADDNTYVSLDPEAIAAEAKRKEEERLAAERKAADEARMRAEAEAKAKQEAEQKAAAEVEARRLEQERLKAQQANANKPPANTGTTNKPETTTTTGNRPANTTGGSTNPNTANSSTTKPAANKPVAKAQPVRLKADLPKQTYKSAGERKPDASHAGSHSNGSGPRMGTPEYLDGDTKMAIYMKTALRNAKVCGLAHVLAELTVGREGTVEAVRLFSANSQQVAEVMPDILKGLKYRPETVTMRQNIYFEFKADINCAGVPAGQVNLGEVKDYLNNTQR